MSISLVKGQKIDLTKGNAGLKKGCVCPWLGHKQI